MCFRTNMIDFLDLHLEAQWFMWMIIWWKLDKFHAKIVVVCGFTPKSKYLEQDCAR